MPACSSEHHALVVPGADVPRFMELHIGHYVGGASDELRDFVKGRCWRKFYLAKAFFSAGSHEVRGCIPLRFGSFIPRSESAPR